MSGSRKKLRAVLLAFVMVISMVAIGGFAGSAAAGSANDISITTTEPVQPGESTTLQFDIDSNANNDFLVGIDANSDNTIQTNEIVSNTQPGTGDGQTLTFTPSAAEGLDSTSDSSFTLAVLQEGNNDGNPSSFGTQGAEDAKLTFDVDGVAPSAEAANTEYLDTDSDAQVDEVHLDFNEDISASTLEAGDFSFNDGQASDLSIDSVQANGDEVEISVTGPAGDTDLGNLDVDYTASAGTADSIVDAAGNPAGDVTDQDVTDGAGPVILSFRRTSSTAAEIVFSEGVSADDSDNDLETGDLTYTNGNGAGANTPLTSITHTAGDSTATVSPTGSITSGDISADTITAGAVIDDAVDNSPGSTSPVTLETGSLAGDSNGEISTAIGSADSQNLRAGSSGQALDLVRVKDISGGDSPLAQRTILRMPDGVTINESQTDLLVTTTSGALEVTGTEVVDENTLRIDHSGSSENGQTLRVNGLVVDTASDVDASQGGTASDIEVDYAIGSLDTALLTAEKPQIQTAGTQDISAGANDQDAASLDPIVVQTGANVDGQIANQSEIVISANASNGVTFNTDTDPTTLTATTSGNAEVDISSATLTEDALTIPVTAHFDAGDSVSINSEQGDTLDLDATGDAEDAKLTATVVANSSTGDVSTQSSANNPDVNIQKPQIDIGNGDANDPAGEAVVGATATDTNDNFVNIGGATDRVDIDFQTSNPLTASSDIVIQTNRSDVTFDTGASTGTTVANNNDQTFDAEVTTGSPSVTNININENEIVVTLDNPQNIGTGDTLSLNELPLSVASSVPDETPVGLVVETSPSSGTTVTTTSNVTDSQGDFLEAERPDALLNNDNNATINVDADGESQFIDPDTGATVAGDETNNALVIDAEDVNDQIDGGTTVTVELEDGTGVTFDQSVTATDSATTGLSNGDDQTTSIDAEFGAVSNVQYSQGQLTFDVDTVSTTGSGEITIDQLFLNLTSDASNTNLTATTTTVSGNDVTTNANAIIEPNVVNPSNVFADANVEEDPAGADVGPNRDGSNGGDFGGTGTGEAVDDATTDDNPTVDETITGSVFVQDGGSDFGGATVNLELVQQPNGSEGASFNTTALTTNSGGVANYEFTVGDTDGTYVVNASTGSGFINITYEAVPGQATDVTVTPIENAIAGENSEVGQAALFVNATDANGNPVQATPTVSVTADNVGASSVAEFNNKAPAGSNNGLGGADDDLTDGEFTVDGDGSSVVEVNTDTVQDVTITVSLSGNSDSGTVTFFEQVGQVDLTLNQSTVEVDDTVAAEATISESDGTTIEVPDVTVNYDDNNGGNTTFEDGADSDSATTNGAGVASVNVTAEQLGSSTIDVQSNLRSDSATITVEEDAPAYYTLKLSNSIADRDVHAAIISIFSTHRQSGSTALLPHSVYRYTRTHTGGQR